MYLIMIVILKFFSFDSKTSNLMLERKGNTEFVPKCNNFSGIIKAFFPYDKKFISALNIFIMVKYI